MNLLQTLRVAARALLRNKMRSFLTTLGIVIGVSAVIAMVAIGEGAKKRVEDAFASMGADILMVLSGTTTRGGRPSRRKRSVSSIAGRNSPEPTRAIGPAT